MTAGGPLGRLEGSAAPCRAGRPSGRWEEHDADEQAIYFFPGDLRHGGPRSVSVCPSAPLHRGRDRQGDHHRDAEDCASDKRCKKKKKIIRPTSCLFKTICGQKINDEFSFWNLKRKEELFLFRSHLALAELEEQLGRCPAAAVRPAAAGMEAGGTLRALLGSQSLVYAGCALISPGFKN